MFRSSAARWIMGAIAFIVMLGVLRFKPWQRGGAERPADAAQAGKNSPSAFCR